MPFVRALSIASATACSTTSMPHSSPARAASERPDGADAAVEVVQALPALERGELGGDAVEPLGHLGVRLEERLRRDREAQPSDLLVDPLVARQEHRAPAARGLADPVGPRPQQAVARHGVDEAVARRSRPGGWARISRTPISPVRRPSRTTRLRSSPVCAAAVERVEAAARAPTRARPRAPRCRARMRAGSRRDADDLLPRAGRVEAADERAGGIGAEGVLELVAVAPPLRPRGRGRRTRSPRGGRCASARRRPARA